MVIRNVADDNGWIKIHRKMIDWEWYQDSNTSRVFVHCLLKAGRKERKYRGTLIPKGGFVTSYEILAKQLNIGIQSVRTSINHLKSTCELTIKSTSKGTLIIVNNWEQYQCCGENITNKLTDNLTNNQQATNKQLTTNKNVRMKEFKETYIIIKNRYLAGGTATKEKLDEIELMMMKAVYITDVVPSSSRIQDLLNELLDSEDIWNEQGYLITCFENEGKGKFY